VRRRETASASSVLTALYAKLVQPVADAGALKGVSRLVIVPHGPLAYLPFGALLDAASGRYVAEQFTLVRVPTAASLPALRDRARAAQRRDLQTSVFAPLPGEQALLDTGIIDRVFVIGIGWVLPRTLGKIGSALQSGRVGNYAWVLVLGVIFVLGAFTLR